MFMHISLISKAIGNKEVFNLACEFLIEHLIGVFDCQGIL